MPRETKLNFFWSNCKYSILDVADADLKTLSDAVVTSAVAGDAGNLSVACNDLLSTANHIVEICAALANHCREQQV